MRFLSPLTKVQSRVGHCPTWQRMSGALNTVLIHPERCAYLPENVKVLKGKDASRAGILDGLCWLRQKLREDKSDNETAVVYFSGHGLRDITGEEPVFYLRPYDAQQDDVAATGLRAETFVAEIQKLNPRRLVVLLDCCHSGGMGAKGAGSSSPKGWKALPCRQLCLCLPQRAPLAMTAARGLRDWRRVRVEPCSAHRSRASSRGSAKTDP